MNPPSADMPALVQQAIDLSNAYGPYTGEQALVYSCEDIVEREIPSRLVQKADMYQVVANIAELCNVDAPQVQVVRGNPSGLRACTIAEHNTIRFYGMQFPMLTVLHEIAHVLSNTGHNITFRNNLVSLVRQQSSVQQASLLHHLYVGTGLSVDPFQSLT